MSFPFNLIPSYLEHVLNRLLEELHYYVKCQTLTHKDINMIYIYFFNKAKQKVLLWGQTAKAKTHLLGRQ